VRIGTGTIVPGRLSGNIRPRWTRSCSPIPSFAGALFPARTAGFAFSRIPATPVGGTCGARLAVGSTIAGSVPASGAPRTGEVKAGRKLGDDWMPILFQEQALLFDPTT